MTTYLYLVGAVVSWFLASGMVFSDLQFVATRKPYTEIDQILAKEHLRIHVGTAVIIGAVFGLFWPLGLPVAWCGSGFAEHGIWRRFNGAAQ